MTTWEWGRLSVGVCKGGLGPLSGQPKKRWKLSVFRAGTRLRTVLKLHGMVKEGVLEVSKITVLAIKKSDTTKNFLFFQSTSRWVIISFSSFFLQNIVVLSFLFDFLRKITKLVNILAPLIFLLEVKKSFFFLTKFLIISLKIFLAKSFKVKKVRYLY